MSRYAEPTWDECQRCGAVVPSGSTFCPECGERLDVRRAADDAPHYESRYDRGYPPARDRRRPAWVPIVLGFGGAAIIGLVVLLAILLTRDEDPETAGASASASVSASTAASADPSGSVEPSVPATPSATPSPTPRPAQANRGIVEIGTDGAELRTQPGGGEVIGTFGAGGRAFVIGTPQEVGGERWYRVAVVEGPYSGCQPEFCPNDIGYLADGTSEADAVLTSLTLECPPSPMAAADLAVLLPLERLACYGSSPIEVSGTLDHCYCDGPMNVSYSPAWLAQPVSLFLFDDTPALWLRFEEDGPVDPDELQAGDIVETTLAMEHDAAPDCQVSGEGDVMSRPEIVLYCRTQLVVQELTVTGFDESVGP